jgi:hypothetical protein
MVCLMKATSTLSTVANLGRQRGARVWRRALAHKGLTVNNHSVTVCPNNRSLLTQTWLAVRKMSPYRTETPIFWLAPLLMDSLGHPRGATQPFRGLEDEMLLFLASAAFLGLSASPLPFGLTIPRPCGNSQSHLSRSSKNNVVRIGSCPEKRDAKQIGFAGFVLGLSSPLMACANP